MTESEAAAWERRVEGSFPVVASVMGKGLGERLVQWGNLCSDELGPWADGIKGLSRPWALTLLSAVGDPRFEDAYRLRRLGLVESALLVVAQHGGAVGAWRRRLEADEGGFLGSLSELLVIQRLGRLGRPMAFEVASGRRGADRNFDIQLELEKGTELHIEVKHRQETPLGTPDRTTEIGFARLLVGDVPEEMDLRILPRKKFLRDDSLVNAAVVADECMRILRGDATGVGGVTRRVVFQDGFPASLVGSCLSALSESESLQMFHVLPDNAELSTEAVLVPEAQEVILARGPIESVCLWPGGGNVLIRGRVERRPLYSRATRESFGDTQRFDHGNSEADKVRGLLKEVPDQLPDDPYNAVVLVTEFEKQWLDIELALFGEPRRGEIERVGGLFDEESWRTVSGVLILCEPYGKPSPQPRWSPNPNAAVPLGEEQQALLIDGLRASAV